MTDNKRSEVRSGFWDLPLFLCQVVLIGLGTAILMVVGASLPLALAKNSGAFATLLVTYDPNGFSIVVLALLPLLLGWWLYTKALRRLAKRLALAVPTRVLGIPIVGEYYVLSAMFFPR